MQYHLNASHNSSNFDTKFCAQCLEDIPNLRKVTGFCKQCKEYVCSSWCIKQHSKNRLTKKHEYLQHGDLKVFLKRSCELYQPLGGGDDISDESDDDILKAPPRLSAMLKTEYKIRGDSDREICSIHATAVLENGRIVLSDLKNNNLKLFDVHKRVCLATYKFEKGTRDICASNKMKTDFYAVEGAILGFHHFKTGDGIELLETISTDRECFGITCWANGIAVVVSADFPSRGKYELRLFNYSGRLMRKITTAKTVGLEFNLPWYLCANSSGDQIFVSDYGNNSVTALDINGSVLFVYKNEELLRPVSMTTNENGDLFIVGQRSHNIHHLSRDLEKKGVIYSEEAFDFPGGLAHDTCSDVYYVQCTGWSDKLQEFVFTYQMNDNGET